MRTEDAAPGPGPAAPASLPDQPAFSGRWLDGEPARWLEALAGDRAEPDLVVAPPLANSRAARLPELLQRPGKLAINKRGVAPRVCWRSRGAESPAAAGDRRDAGSARTAQGTRARIFSTSRSRVLASATRPGSPCPRCSRRGLPGPGRSRRSSSGSCRCRVMHGKPAREYPPRAARIPAPVLSMDSDRRPWRVAYRRRRRLQGATMGIGSRRMLLELQ